jgi:hypothetical protein
MLFPDRRQLSLHLQRRFERPNPPDAPACVADVREGHRAILCDATSLRSRGGAVMTMGHELTHHLLPLNSYHDARLPAWYDEGLAEYVGSQILAAHLQHTQYRADGLGWLEWGYGADFIPYFVIVEWSWRERRLADEVRSGRQVALDQGWTSSRLDYVRASLAVAWLIECFGLEAVVAVAQETGRTGAFAAAFTDAFGMTQDELEQQLSSGRRIRFPAPRS